MKKIITVSISFFLCNPIFSQDPTIKNIQSATTTPVKIEDTIRVDKHGWKKGGIFNFNLTQISNSNWVAADGDKFSLSAAASLNLFAGKTWNNTTWDNVLDINYALINTSTLGIRKVNDRIDFVSRLSIKPKGWQKVSIGLLGQFRSQLTSGYDYDYFGSGEKRRNSGFFAPAYITIAPGIEYKPTDWLTIFGSPAATRFTIVSNDPYSFADPSGIFKGNVETPLVALYGVDPEKKYKTEFGSFVTVTARKTILKNVQYVGRLDLYSNYLKNPQNIDLFMTNAFQLKVNKWLMVSYNLDLLYDDDVKQKQVDENVPPNSVGLQILSTIGVGFSVKL